MTPNLHLSPTLHLPSGNTPPAAHGVSWMCCTCCVRPFVPSTNVSAEFQASSQVPGTQPQARQGKPRLSWVLHCVRVGSVGVMPTPLTALVSLLPLASDSCRLQRSPDTQISSPVIRQPPFLQRVIFFVTTSTHFFSFPLGSPDPTWHSVSHLRHRGFLVEVGLLVMFAPRSCPERLGPVWVSSLTKLVKLGNPKK